MLKINSTQLITLALLTRLCATAQSPATIVFPNPTPNPLNAAVDSYTRATTKINLQDGFKYGFVSGGASNLLNLNISAYPGYVNNNYVNPSTTPDYFTQNSALGTAVTSGVFNVNNTGGFNYSIPVVCSPGTAGMEPNLSISYQSGETNNWLGLGFELSGISVITRTGKSTLYDNKSGGVGFNSEDVFALDGSRLLHNSGTYGQDLTTYKTPVENYYRIVSLGSQGTASYPLSFTVTTPDGLTMEYGNTSSSRNYDNSGAEILSWYINKVYDVFGNYMTYSYTNSGGELLIDRIEYTGNSVSSLTPYNKIEFEYMERSDVNSYYVGGKEFKRKHILKSIVSKGINANIVRRYNFEYKYEFASLLSKIIEVDAHGNQLNPTCFEWVKEGKSATHFLCHFNPNIPNVPNTAEYDFSIPADLNGDGMKDLLLMKNNQVFEAKVMINNVQSNYCFALPTSPVNFVAQGNALNIRGSSVDYIASFAFDEDDDDNEEVFILYSYTVASTRFYQIDKIKNVSGTITASNETSGVMSSNSVPNTWKNLPFNNNQSQYINKSSWFYAKEDISGDKLRDVILINQDGISVSPSGNSGFFVSSSNIIKSEVGDFDGDGVLDIYTLKTGGSSGTYVCDVYKYDAINNTIYVQQSVAISPGLSPNIASWQSFLYSAFLAEYANGEKSVDFGDFNRDGKTDILYVNYINPTDANAYVLKSNGISFVTDPNPIRVPVMLNGAEANFSAMDVNNDGYSDLVLSSYDNVNLRTNFDHYPSNGNFLTAAFGLQMYNDKYLGALADFNGDGSMDYIFQNGFAYCDIVFNSFNQNNKKLVNHIFNIKDDLRISYGYLPGERLVSLPSHAYYMKGGPFVNTAPAFKNVKPHIFVVRETNYNNRIFMYGYRNSVYHPQGLGFVGFEKAYTLDKSKVFNNTEYLGNVSVFGYDAAYDAVSNIEKTRGYFSGPGNFVTNTAKIAMTTTQIFNYTQNIINRYLASITATTKNYLSSTCYLRYTTYDNANGGKVLSNQHSNLTWIAQTPINTFQSSYTYQTLTNPINSANYIRTVKEIKSRTANSNTSSYHTDYTFNSQSGYLQSIVVNSNIAGKDVTMNLYQHNAFGMPCSLKLSAPNVAARDSKVQYDATGRFAIQSTDALNNTEQAVYEPTYGNVTEVTGIDGQISKFEYDGLGRLKNTKSPTGAVNDIKYEWYSYSDNWGSHYGLKSISNYEGNGSEINYFNRNDLLRKTESTGFGGNTIVSENQFTDDNILVQSIPFRFANQSLYKLYTYGYDEYMRPNGANQYNNSSVLINSLIYTYNNLSTNSTYNKGFVKLQEASGDGSTNHFKMIENNEAGQMDKVINYTNANAQHLAAYTFNQHNQPTQVVTSFPGGSGGGTTTFGYDALGRQVSITDPSSGLSQFEYNNFGELTKYTNAAGQIYDYGYDVLGRPTVKTGSGLGNYTFDYVLSGDGRGQLKKITGPSVLTEYLYDAYSRPIQKKETLGAGISAKEFKTKYSYDKYNRLVDYTYPNNFTTTHEYDANGQLAKIKNNTSVIWELTGMKSPELLESYKNSANLSTQVAYDNYLNLSQINLGTLSSQGYTVAGTTGNLLRRTHQDFTNATNNNEGFGYDGFNRLLQTDYVNAFANTVVKDVYSYNANGNLDYKQDCGNYVYGLPNKPYQLTGIQNPVGNISLNTLNMTLNDLSKVNQITESVTNKSFDFTYGNDEQRIKMEYKISNQLQYTRYYQDNYDRQESGNTYKDWCYIYSPAGLAAVYYDNNGTTELLDVTSDHLGSPLLLTNQSGQTVEEYSFDAWGRRRNPADWTYNNIPASTKMIRGYTGHEHLDEIGLINMNGRVYDPVLGRFIQPDPFIQDPLNLQNMNRFSYVINNPLNYIDPSGYGHGRPYESVYYGSGTSIISNDGTEYYNMSFSGNEPDGGGSEGALFSGYLGGGGSYSGGSGTGGGGGNGGGGGISSSSHIIKKPGSKGDPFAPLPEMRVGLGGLVSINNEPGGENIDNRNYGGDGSGDMMDMALRVVDVINQFNPIAHLMDNVSFAFTGSDRLGNKMSLGDAWMKSASVFPIGRVGVFGSSVAKGAPTIVGEGMKRVSMEAAKHPGSVILNNMPKFTGAPHQVTSQMMTYNRQWLLQQMRSGRPIIDIGLDPTRGAPSIFYQMEQNMMKNYLKLHPGAF